MKSVTATALAVHLCCGREAIDGYRVAKIITKLPDGKYDQDECRARVLRHLRDRAGGRSGLGDGAAGLAKARAKLAEEQRETAALKNALTRGELVRVDAVQKVVETDYSNIRENFLGAPGANADVIAAAARDAPSIDAATQAVDAMLVDIIHEILKNLSEPNRVASQAAELERKSR